ncbi:MAG: hypothetical protein H0X33_14530 [Taibaiella sp.]|nr:hypothetical protein [Taibaiella sp.]
MPFLVKTDLYTHIQPEVITEITRSTDAIVTDAINGAISKASSFLSRYDRLALFGNATTDPTYTDANLTRTVKDIACWDLIVLCNASIDLPLFEIRYNHAVKYLKEIQAGIAEPFGWPVFNAANAPLNIGDSVSFNSYPKRSNNY